MTDGKPNHLIERAAQRLLQAGALGGSAGQSLDGDRKANTAPADGNDINRIIPVAAQPQAQTQPQAQPLAPPHRPRPPQTLRPWTTGLPSPCQ